MEKKLLCTPIVSAWLVPLAVTSGWAQPTVQFPQSPGSAGAGLYAPPTAASLAPSGTTPSRLGTPSFDPFASSSGSTAYTQPLGSTSAYGSTGAPVGAVMPPGGALTAPTVTVPPAGAPSTVPGVAPYGTTGLGTVPGTYPPGTYPPGTGLPGTYPPGAGVPTTPPALFPNGLNSASWTGTPLRFLTPRARYTWVTGGGDASDLGINDFDFSAAMAFPNFMFSTQPLYVVPSFSLHLWSGPESPHDLPANAYSAFLDFGWGTDPRKPLGGEVGVRMGAFTDFNTMNSTSWRILGQGLIRLQTTPTVALRGGVIYINRNDLKLLPAFGLLWTPNSQTRFDIFFPKPKLSQRLTTLGNYDVWWYIAGEYGGGSWTIQREAGFSDRVDINDLRLILGAEWGQSTLLQQGRRVGFFEAGWVTNREVWYVATPGDRMKPSDAFMLRVGVNY